MRSNADPVPLIKILYVKDPGAGTRSEIEVLRSLPWVQEVIVAEFNNDVAQYAAQADCIFIAGSSYDPSAEYCCETPTRPPANTHREAFELKIIRIAKEHGIPLLAVCAGSWRLTNAHGSKTYAVPLQDVPMHEEWATVRMPDKLTHLRPGTMLHNIHLEAQRSRTILFSADGKAQKKLGRTVNNSPFNPNTLPVNTTHWRVSPTPESQLGTEFNARFETSALDARHGTVEGYESKHGVPTMAVQWHPEYVIPQIRKPDGSTMILEAYKTHRNILDTLAETGVTYHRKRLMQSELLNRFRRGRRLRARL
jgi:gamma-glutamyl-gamma-aminobutyrate hydrolase PuuD